MLSKIYPYLIGIAIGIIVLVCFSPFKKCNGKGVITTELAPGTYKEVKKVEGEIVKGVAKDSVVIKYVPKIVVKRVVKIEHDTVHQYHVANDLVTYEGITFDISDTIKGDSIDRKIKIAGVDSIYYRTRLDLKTDTLYLSKTDTLRITEKQKGLGWKRFKQGVVVGGLLGLAGGVFIAKP